MFQLIGVISLGSTTFPDLIFFNVHSSSLVIKVLQSVDMEKGLHCRVEAAAISQVPGKV